MKKSQSEAALSLSSAVPTFPDFSEQDIPLDFSLNKRQKKANNSASATRTALASPLSQCAEIAVNIPVSAKQQRRDQGRRHSMGDPTSDEAAPVTGSGTLKRLLEEQINLGCSARSAFEPVSNNAIGSDNCHFPITGLPGLAPNNFTGLSMSMISPFFSSIMSSNSFLPSSPSHSDSMDPGLQRHVRPFKAYNPLDPASALQILPDISKENVANESGSANTGLQAAASALLVAAHYRQLLLNARNASTFSMSIAAASNVTSGRLPEAMGCEASAALPGSVSRSNCSINFTPSPPEAVSSTVRHLSGTSNVKSTASVPRSGTGVRENSNSPTSTSDLYAPVLANLQRKPSENNRLSTNKDSSSIEDSDERSSSADRSDPDGTGTNAINQGTANRRPGKSLPEELKDEAYWERRRKNNEAAKRSRDSRRAKEDEIAIRAALLEQENMKLRFEVAALKGECEKLRHMLFNT